MAPEPVKASSPRSHFQQLAELARQAMLERGLSPDFPAAALAELGALRGPARPDGASLRDLRALPWCSIDNDDSRDLDQLSVAQESAGAEVHVLVAVADVDALVGRASALDGHAQQNTTSVYTAGGIFPMLPERLSTDLTSLNEGEEREALVMEYAVRSDGSLGGEAIYRAVVQNRAKLAYDSVAAWLDGKGPMPAPVARVPEMERQLRIQDDCAQKLRKRRHEQGALALQTLAPRAVLEGGRLVDLVSDPRNRAKDLIEEFMVAANGTAARFLAAQGQPSMRRVVRQPERWDRIVAVARDLGETLPPKPDARALEGFLAKRSQADPLRFPDLSLDIVKMLGRGEYVVELPGQPSVGHFGLAVRDYTHGTAPNRRFPDLITGRLIKAALARQACPYGTGDLAALAAHCSAQETNADKVERQIRKSAAALLLERRVGQRFDGIVTGASEKGTWVRLLAPPVEGRLVHGFESLDIGHRVRVKLVSADVPRGYLDFVRA
ncbi:MAG: RNB domain-containing ribonuclease [Myxococcales bacterium]